MAEDGAVLRARAEQCRRLARGVSTDELAHTLTVMAEDYENRLAAAEAEDMAPPAARPER